MEGTATLEKLPRTDAEYKAAISQLIAEMKKTSTEMKETQHEIESLHADIRAQMTRLEAMIEPCPSGAKSSPLLNKSLHSASKPERTKKTSRFYSRTSSRS